MMSNYTSKIGTGFDGSPGEDYPHGYGATRSRDILVLMAVTIILVLPILVLRLYTRIRIVHFLGWDDWLITIAALGTTIFAAFSTYTVISPRFANGEHVEYVTRKQVKNFFITFWVFEMGYTMALTIVKSSILVYYIRLQRLLIFIYTLIFVVLFGISITLTFFFQCNPVQRAWDVRESGSSRSCINVSIVVFVSAALNIATDFWVWFLAIRMLKGLKVPRRQKIGVILIFSVGVIACVSSIVRFWTIKRYYDSDDPTWDMFHLYVWSFLEIGLGILAACIPTIKPLVQRLISGFDGPNPVRRTRSWRMRGVCPGNPSGDGSQSLRTAEWRQRPSLSSAKMSLASWVFALFSRDEKSWSDNTNNTTTTGLSEARDWGLEQNDFCIDPDRRHTLPDAEEDQQRRRRIRIPDGILDVEAASSVVAQDVAQRLEGVESESETVTRESGNGV